MFLKDPAAELDYAVDWSKWLGDDTISGSVWHVTPEGALTVGMDTHNDTTTRVWVSGGVRGQSVRLTNRVSTAGGRTDERTVPILVTER